MSGANLDHWSKLAKGISATVSPCHLVCSTAELHGCLDAVCCMSSAEGWAGPPEVDQVALAPSWTAGINCQSAGPESFQSN